MNPVVNFNYYDRRFAAGFPVENSGNPVTAHFSFVARSPFFRISATSNSFLKKFIAPP